MNDLTLFAEFSFVKNFHDKIMCPVQSYSFRHSEVSLWYKKEWNAKFLPLKHNSVAMGLKLLLDFISAIASSNTINTFIFFVGL